MSDDDDRSCRDGGSAQGPGAFQQLGQQECLELLGTTTVGRVAFSSSAGLQLLPVNFVARDGVIYFRTSSETILAELSDGDDDVAFEVDYHDGMFQFGWSVLVKGTAAAIEEDGELAEALSGRRPAPWAAGSRPLFIRLTPTAISGRRVRAAH